MLEERSCLVSSALRSSAGEDTKWVVLNCFMEVTHGKRRYDDDGEELLGKRRSLNRFVLSEEDGITPTLHNLFPSPVNQSDQQGIDSSFNLTLQVEESGLRGELKASKSHDLELSLSNLSCQEIVVSGSLHAGDGGDNENGRKHASQIIGTLEKEDLTLSMSDLQLSPPHQFDESGMSLPENEREKLQNGKRKSSGLLDSSGKEEMTLSLHDLRLSSTDQSLPCNDYVQVNFRVKRPLDRDVQEAFGQRKSRRPDTSLRDEMTCTLYHLTLSPSDHSEQQGSGGDQGDTSSLISSLGRDISINCLLRCSRSNYNVIALLNSSFRNLIRSGDLYILRRKMGVIEHWVYFSCDVLEWEAFDPMRRRWMRLPRMPSNECFRCSDKESVAVGTELLVFGKEITSHVIWKYSILTNSWSSGMEMNAPRCLFGSASLGEIAILAGGCDSQGRVLSSAELYNSENGTWETLPSMKKPRKMCSGVFMDGKFYVIGGSNTDLLSCGEEYNLETKSWREIPNMCPRRTGPTEAPPLVAVVNNELYAADYAERELMKYNKERISWDTIGRLPERAFSMNGWGLAFRACGDQLIVIGGPRAVGGGMIELNSWVPREGQPQWNLLARKHSGSFVYNCAVMGC